MPLRSDRRSVSPSNVSTSKSGAVSASVLLVDRMVLGVGAGVAVTVGSGVGEDVDGVGSGVEVGVLGIAVGAGTGTAVSAGRGCPAPPDWAHETVRKSASSRMMQSGEGQTHLDVSRGDVTKPWRKCISAFAGSANSCPVSEYRVTFLLMNHSCSLVCCTTSNESGRSFIVSLGLWQWPKMDSRLRGNDDKGFYRSLSYQWWVLVLCHMVYNVARMDKSSIAISPPIWAER